ncbi:MAG: hypothetical protein M3003_08290, partial [Candidatus Dormibacteraeota bacterium]|nr:hypothetical protein [Candidatus Dormibacteraeota bacterium]
MPDLLVIYGAIAGSAGLLSLGWQIAVRREDNKTRVSLDVSHHLRTLHPGDAGYDKGLQDALDSRPNLPPDARPYVYVFEAGTVVTVTNHSRHSIHVRGGGLEQPETGGMCAMWGPAVTEVKPRTTFREFWIRDSWSEGEEGMKLRSHPVRGFVDLDDGQTYHSELTWLYP